MRSGGAALDQNMTGETEGLRECIESRREHPDDLSYEQIGGLVGAIRTPT